MYSHGFWYPETGPWGPLVLIDTTRSVDRQPGLLKYPTPTKKCLAKLIRLLEHGDILEKEAALKTIYFFESDKRISEAVTKYILPIESVSEKGFQVMEKQQGKFVTKLIKIAFLDNNDNYWMDYF